MPHDLEIGDTTYPDVPYVQIPNPDGELVPYLDPDDFVLKKEIENAGIESVTYATFGPGTMTITTAAETGYDHPRGIDDTSAGYDSESVADRFRITYDGTEYVIDALPIGYLATAAKLIVRSIAFGNPSMIPDSYTVPDRKNNGLPFVLLRSYTTKNVWELFTTEAGSHTLKLEVATITSKKLPNTLIYGDEYQPFVVGDNDGVAFGPTASAGYYSFAEGIGSKAIGAASHAEGGCSLASGNGSHAEGWANSSGTLDTPTTASGVGSHAEGIGTIASGYAAHSEGQLTTASGKYAHTEGYQTVASGNQAHAEGINGTAAGNSSHVEGQRCEATGTMAHSGGNYSKSNGRATFAHGNFTDAEVASSFVVGYSNDPQEDSIFEVGNGLNADGDPNNTGNVEPVTRQNAFRVTQDGTAIAQTALQIGDTSMDEDQLKGILEGGGGAQSDWNENDTTKPAYVKNRPFWIEEQEGVYYDYLRATESFDLDKKLLYRWDHSINYGYMDKNPIPFTEFSEDIVNHIEKITIDNGVYVGDMVRIEVVYGMYTEAENPAIKIDCTATPNLESSWRTVCIIAFNEGKEASDATSYAIRMYDDDYSWENPMEVTYTGLAWCFGHGASNKIATLTISDEGTTKIYHQIPKEFIPDTGVNLGKYCDYLGKEFCTFRRGIAIGDSITEGNMNLDTDPSQEKILGGVYSYPTMIEKMTGVPVYNAGIAGATSQDWLDAQEDTTALGGSWDVDGFVWNMDNPKTLSLSGYDFAIIHIGINDAANNVIFTSLKSNIEEMCDRLKAASPGIRIFVCTIIPTYASGQGIWIDYYSAIKSLDDPDNGVFVVDLYKYSNLDKNSAFTRNHLTAFGYNMMAKGLIGYISYIMANDKRNNFRDIQFACGTDDFDKEVPFYIKKYIQKQLNP